MCVACNVNRLYKEKITQVIEKLKEVEAGVASEYLNPVAQLEDNRRTRVTVAGNIRQTPNIYYGNIREFVFKREIRAG